MSRATVTTTPAYVGGTVAAGGNTVPACRPDRAALAVMACLVVTLAAAALVTPSFLTVDNATAILRNAAIVGIVAVAMTPITLSGNFVSLAIGESAMLAMVAFVALLGAGVPELPAMLAVLAVLMATAALQGVLVAVGLNPIITTLAAGAIIFGVVAQATGGGIVRTGVDAMPTWGTSRILGIPVQVLVFLLWTALVTLVMGRTVIGRQIILVGANRRTARISGISTTRVTLVAFAIFAVGLAIAGILNGAAFGEATAQSFRDLSIDVIAAVLVGGTAIQGGRGSPWQSAVGALLIAVVGNVMLLNDFSTGGRRAFEGAVVVGIVVLLDLWRHRQGGRL
ncbi:MAG: ABC transporter permease [Geminicoccaceae bacterium]